MKLKQKLAFCRELRLDGSEAETPSNHNIAAISPSVEMRWVWSTMRVYHA